jgi:Ca-activated chloride channel family protein
MSHTLSLRTTLSLRITLSLRASALACAAISATLALAALTDWGAARAASKKQSTPTEGSLRALNSTGQPAGLCPLKHTDVRAEISGFLARVNVTQEFANPFSDKIEAVYTFPLPQNAAVDEMKMRVGERTIEGKIMRREEARATYEEARARGQVASLLDQERPNIFTQSVANIAPGAHVLITISYVETLKYDEGTYEWSFPMTIGERYIPAAQRDANGATSDADAARINPTRVPKGMRAGHDVSVEVSLDAGVPVESLSSKTHEIEFERADERRAVVRLRDQSAIPNKDFTLRYDVAGRKIEDALLAHRAARGGFFTLILQPPERVTVEDVMPKELVFVLDTSGSMEGFPIEKAKETMRLALDGLYPQDTFNLITFAGDTEILFPEPVPATPENLRAAKKFLSNRKGDGGTEMMKAIRAALAPSDAQGRVRVVCFMTDGQVGNDMEIISEVQKHPNARVFAMGFSDSPNRFLLDKMAEYGMGEVEYVAEGDDGSAAARRFHRRVREPLLTDMSVEWSDLAVEDVYPKRIPDLFSAKPVVLAGRYARGGTGTIRLTGRMSGRDFVREIPVTLPDAEEAHDVLAALWARRRVDDLMGQDMAGAQQGQMRDDLRREITQLGLDFRLMTQFTSFVAVDETSATGGGEPRRVDVPAESPASGGGVAASGVYNGGGNVNSSVGIASGSVGVARVGSVYNGPVGIVGSVTESVTIMSSADSMDTYSSSASTTITSQRIAELPLNGRNTLDLMMLAPGSAPNGANQARVSGQEQIAVNGQRPSSNSFAIDGINANAGVGAGARIAGATSASSSPGATAYGGASGLVSQESVQELSIDTRSTDVGRGRSTGAHVSVTTRSGTNDFHGSLYEYFGHDALDANDWFANSRAARRAEHRQNLFGATLGGPVRRDRAFFFFSYEGLRLRQPLFGITDVPSSAARLAASSALRPFLEAFPSPTSVARADNFAEFASPYSNPARLDSTSFRFDENVTENLSINARYNFAASSTEARGAGYSLNTINRLTDRAQTLTSGLSYMFSSTVAGDLHANFSRFALRRSERLDNFGGALVSLDSTTLTRDLAQRDALFNFDLDGRSAALAVGGDTANVQRQFNLVGSVTRVAGTHTFKFGADYRRLFLIVRPPVVEFNALFNGVAGALNGTASRQSLYARAGERRPVFNDLSAYAQDSWRMSPRLTLTYGLRWELNAPPSAREGDEPFALTDAHDPARISLSPRAAPLWSRTYGNFAPRAGVAYTLSNASGRETILRGGFGVFYDLADVEAGDAFGDTFPFVAARNVFDSPFPQFTNEATLPALDSATPNGVPFVAFSPHLRLPYTLQWNVSVEREIGRRQTIAASYVGTAGRRLLLTETFFDATNDFPLVRLTTNGASSRYHALQLEFRRRFTHGFSANANYTLSKSLDDASQDSLARTLLRSDRQEQERGASDFDVRHLLTGYLSYELPKPFSSGFGYTLLRRWTLDAIFVARSARPVNVVYAVPTLYGFAYLRPDRIEGVPLYLRDPAQAGGWRINPAAFAVPLAARQGTLARNSLRGFPFDQLDAALRRQFNFNERVSLQLGAEAFNLLNRANFEDPAGADATLGSRLSPADIFRPNLAFGRSTSMLARGVSPGAGAGYQSFHNPGGARTIQLSLKLRF